MCPPLEDLLSDERAREAHVATCDPCRRSVLELLEVAARLRPDDGEFDDPELAHDVGTLIKLGHASSRPRRRFGAPVAIAAMVLAAAAAVVLVPREGGDGFASRSGSAEATDRWVSIDAFYAREGETGYTRVHTTLQPTDALLFAIENHEKSPYRYAMILAFDERGEVFWYHPAYLDADSNPRSIDAPHGRHPLDEAVKHDLTPGWLRVVGLFSKTPLDVKSVEAIVRTADPTSDARLPFDDTGQHSFLLRVESP